MRPAWGCETWLPSGSAGPAPALGPPKARLTRLASRRINWSPWRRRALDSDPASRALSHRTPLGCSCPWLPRENFLGAPETHQALGPARDGAGDGQFLCEEAEARTRLARGCGAPSRDTGPLTQRLAHARGPGSLAWDPFPVKGSSCLCTKHRVHPHAVRSCLKARARSPTPELAKNGGLSLC